MTQPGLKTFSSKKFEKVTYNFELDGKTYYATPGKSAEVQMAIMTGAGDPNLPGQLRSTTGMLHWFLRSLSKDHIGERFDILHAASVADCAACEVMDRLRKSPEEDPLEMDTLLDVANWLIEEIGKRPTT